MAQISRTNDADIENGNVIDADDLDAELDNLVAAHNVNDTELTAIGTGTYTFSGVKTFSSTPKMNAIDERTAGSGVTIDSVLLKDGMATVAGTAAANGQIGYVSNQFKGYRNGSLLNFLMAGDASTKTVTSRSSNTIWAAADLGAVFVCTSTFTQTITAAATLGAGWFCYIRNDGTGVITIDPNSSETIDGETTILVNPGESFLIVCDGSNFKTIGRTIIANIADQTITLAGTLTIAHNLGKTPTKLEAQLVCQTTDGGYQVGEVVSVSFTGDGSPATAGFGVSLWADATNVYAQYGNGGFVLPKRSATVGTATTVTNSSWKLRIRAKLV